MPGVGQGSMTNFPDGFAAGLSIRGMPLTQMQPGKVFFVNNTAILDVGAKAGSDSNRGTYQDPLATINYAVNSACVQGRGDIVFVLPGHAEAIPDAATLSLQCAGVAVIGLGAGNARPRITFNTANTANIPLRAANVSLQSMIFIANFADVASMFTGARFSMTGSVAAGTAPGSVAGVGGIMTITTASTGTVYPGMSVMGALVPPGTIVLSQISGTTGGTGTYQLNNSFTFASGTLTGGAQDFAIDNCEFRDTSSILNALTIITDNATAQSLAGLSFTRNKISSLGTTAATTAIKLTGAAHDRVTILNNYGNWAVLNDTACMLAAGSNNLTNFLFGNNILNKPNTSSTGGSFISGTGTAWTGQAYGNLLWQLDNSAGIWIPTGTKLAFNQNFSPITGAADTSGLINPAAA